MKSLILVMALIFSSFTYANSNELAVDVLKKSNAQVDITKLQLAQTYNYSRTCAATNDDGYCTQYGEHVYTLNNNIYTNIASYNYEYKTADNYDVKWRCWTDFGTDLDQYYAHHENSVNEIANYPADLKKEYRAPYTGTEDAHKLYPAGVYYFVKEPYQVLKTKLIEHTLTEGKNCSYGDVGDDSEPVCYEMRKWRRLVFTAPVNNYSSFSFRCEASVPVESKDQLNLTTEILHKVLKGEAFIK